MLVHIFYIKKNYVPALNFLGKEVLQSQFLQLVITKESIVFCFFLCNLDPGILDLID
jgi:hypothetical protein